MIGGTSKPDHAASRKVVPHYFAGNEMEYPAPNGTTTRPGTPGTSEHHATHNNSPAWFKLWVRKGTTPFWKMTVVKVRTVVF